MAGYVGSAGPGIFGVPEVGPGLGYVRAFERVRAIRQHRGVADVADAVFVLEAVGYLRGIGNQRKVELLEQPFGFATDAVASGQVHHVPGDLAALDLGLDDRVGLGRAVLFERQTELFRRRLQDRLALGFLISTALGYERDVLGHGLGGATDEQGQTRELESCSAQCAHGKTPNGWQIFLGEL